MSRTTTKRYVDVNEDDQRDAIGGRFGPALTEAIVGSGLARWVAGASDKSRTDGN